MDKDSRRVREYQKLVERMTPDSRLFVCCLRAFWVGGVICAIGQGISMLGEWLCFEENVCSMFTSVTLIFLGTTLTGLGIYDRIGRYAGAGSIVPITGFANSVAAPAIEFRREGFVMGIGTKLFAVAGPVLTYGITASIVVGVIYWAAKEWLL